MVAITEKYWTGTTPESDQGGHTILILCEDCLHFEACKSIHPRYVCPAVQNFETAMKTIIRDSTIRGSIKVVFRAIRDWVKG